jgi:hypothetical protein
MHGSLKWWVNIRNISCCHRTGGGETPWNLVCVYRRFGVTLVANHLQDYSEYYNPEGKNEAYKEETK